MLARICTAIFAVLFLLPWGSAQSETKIPLPPAKIMSVTLPDKIPWQRSGYADTADVVGGPDKPGLFIELVRWHAGNMSRPHMHTVDRYITVLEGTWWLGSGSTYDPASTYPVKEGTFVVHKKGEMHYDGAKDKDCVIEIVQINP